ncbi:helix-hairpin-helix domain-containing protein [Epibacterium ulvae]|uniref:helix-hairpin-helix domain-containing protein n=1 Tax=Epibacterium ulvae TaxID=1156985 RepID=UPI0024904083|nr:helix-hairpin-helix domain-containing protein [Epibacterium ulvae]
MTAISKLKGVGPVLAKVLESKSVTSVEDIAAMDRATLIAFPGIGSRRADIIMASAKELTSPSAKGDRRTKPSKPTASGKSAQGASVDSKLNAALVAAEAARQAAEEKASKAKAKAKKAKRKAAMLAEEFAAAKIKAKAKAKKEKAKAKKAIAKERAKAKAILDGKKGKKSKK